MSCPLPNVLQPKHADPMRGMQVQLQPLNYHDRKPTAVAGKPRTLCDFFRLPGRARMNLWAQAATHPCRCGMRKAEPWACGDAMNRINSIRIEIRRAAPGQ